MTTNIQATATAFEERVKALLHIRVENIDSNVTVIMNDVSDLRDDVGDVSKGIATVDNTMDQGFKEGFKRIQALEDLLTGIATNVECLYSSFDNTSYYETY